MRLLLALLLLLPVLSAAAQSQSTPATSEHLGTVTFANSCSPASQPAVNRGVALLHDFWYEEAKGQFERLAKADPTCAIDHWGLAMSGFHQIWDRPDADTMQYGWAQIEQAQALQATQRERDYLAALATFYRPGKADYPTRIAAYSAAMAALYAKYPADTDAGAFYALSLLADDQPNDTTPWPGTQSHGRPYAAVCPRTR